MHCVFLVRLRPAISALPETLFPYWALVRSIDGPDGHVLVLHHPGGGCRRFRIVSDGRGVIPADGAEQAQLALAGDNMIDVTVANDRYRFPATIGPKAD